MTNSKPNNSNGYFSKQNLLIYGTILGVGGGGFAAGGQSAAQVERRVDSLETTQAVILEKVRNIEANQDRIEAGNKDAHDAILNAIEKLDNN